MSDLLYQANAFIKQSKRLITTEKIKNNGNEITHYGASETATYSEKYSMSVNKTLAASSDNYLTQIMIDDKTLINATVVFKTLNETISSIIIPTINKITKSIVFNDFKFIGTETFKLGDELVNIVKPNTIIFKTAIDLSESKTIESVLDTGVKIEMIQQISEVVIEESNINNVKNMQLPTIDKVRSLLNNISDDIDASYRIYDKVLNDIYQAYPHIIISDKKYALNFNISQTLLTLYHQFNTDQSSLTIPNAYIDVNKITQVIVNGIKITTFTVVNNNRVYTFTPAKNVSVEITVDDAIKSNGEEILTGVSLINNWRDGFMYLSDNNLIFSDDTNTITIATIATTDTSGTLFIGSMHNTPCWITGKSGVVDTIKLTISGSQPITIIDQTLEEITDSTGKFITASIYENQIYILVDNVSIVGNDIIESAFSSKLASFVFIYDVEGQLVDYYEVGSELMNEIYLGKDWIAVNTKNDVAYCNQTDIIIHNKRTYTISTTENSKFWYDDELNLFVNNGKIYNRDFIITSSFYITNISGLASYGSYVYVLKNGKVNVYIKQYKYKYDTSLVISNDLPNGTKPIAADNNIEDGGEDIEPDKICAYAPCNNVVDDEEEDYCYDHRYECEEISCGKRIATETSLCEDHISVPPCTVCALFDAGGETIDGEYYCSSCAADHNEPDDEDEPEPDDEPDDTPANVCSTCGVDIEDGEDYCINHKYECPEKNCSNRTGDPYELCSEHNEVPPCNECGVYDADGGEANGFYYCSSCIDHHTDEPDEPDEPDDADNRCEWCGGNGYTEDTCGSCGGSGYDPGAGEGTPCPECNGTCVIQSECVYCNGTGEA